ncbi:hypothetical protein FA95DRAFT_997648 [Auriscalpium vulgare]|uniref:Uncharacterized protein n=1 Tax=Auriscalpium vulgare TaxID=40419 RepID=A0ACB8RX71_9AGAM|nr:hypothetical protein FA95DRAFT_997648 [Auriscalpium vulgare]
MKQENLLDSSSSSEDENNDTYQLTINEHYAKAFAYRKEREELQKLKDKYGEDAELEGSGAEEYSDSESDESEDEDGEELTPAVDAAILRTLARIKRRDPGIYEDGKNVFDEERSKSGTLNAPTRKPKDKSSKPLTLPAHRLAAAINEESTSSDEDDAPRVLTHAEEQEQLRAETIAAFGTNGAARDEEEEEKDDDALFTLREKTKDEIEEEQEAYRQYLEREVGGLEDLVEVDAAPVDGEVKREDGDEVVKEKKKKKKKGKGKGKEKEEVKETDQEFLLNYILNRGWIDKSAKRVPTYSEVTKASRDAVPKANTLSDDGDVKNEAQEGPRELLSDEEFEDVVDKFESSYNFRFEEPDAPHIPSFPRAVESVRRPAPHTEKRKEARERKKERKDEEVRVRKEEVKRLKNLKMKEMESKLARIGKEGGFTNSKALEVLDLEGDWDPSEYDKQMAAILEQEGDGPDEKPSWDDDIDVGDIIPPSDEEDDGQPRASSSKSIKDLKKEKKREKKKKKAKAEHGDDGVDVDAMDADAEPVDADGDEEEWDGTEEMRKRVLDKYMEDLFELEFNDLVAGQPTRFRYTPVAKSAYALTPAEILVADDRDLNEYMGIKKIAPYRKEKSVWDPRRATRLRELKAKLSGKGAAVQMQAEEGEVKPAKKRKGKKERLKAKAAVGAGEGEGDGEGEGEAHDGGGEGEEKAKRRRGNGEEVEEEHEEGPAKKKRRRHKKGGKESHGVHVS